MRRMLLTLGLAFAAVGVLAQTQAPAAPAPTTQAETSLGVKSANVFQLAPGADADAKYKDQTNAERGQVQPGNNAPMWRAVGQGVTGYTSLPKSQAPEAGNLIQPFVQYPGSRLASAGESWRQVRNKIIIPYGAALLLIAVGSMALFYVSKGTMELHGQETGRKIERFTPFERSAHWANAIAFVSLAISGIVMAYGKFFLLPIIGSTLFGWLTFALKNIHNFAGPLFAVSLVIVFVTFLKDNLPSKDDLVWIAKGGGLFSGTEVPSHRFNAGEKVVFWGGVLFLGLIVVGSGLVLDMLIPGLIYERGTMQIAAMIHGVAALFMMAMFIGHIYMGTIGMRGAYKAMREGYVDETWAKEHHELWYNDVKSGKIPAQRSVPASSTTATPVKTASV
ncbi:formate dehydrogenase subunit gamma [Limnohabitans sp.]|uniref:formate dehydrogenase subunit gamma n=1 Tax=Limnohabitans sp. TaxID=1907725 RepID=UPI002AFE44D1|nr:formate dehydrogenase subunit gamma [Limnohabitans sp.]